MILENRKSKGVKWTDCKSKLNLQRQTDRTLEKLQHEMMDILHITFEEKPYAKCLNELKCLQETVLNSVIRENCEVILYANANLVKTWVFTK